jgi:hypothetical protein
MISGLFFMAYALSHFNMYTEFHPNPRQEHPRANAERRIAFSSKKEYPQGHEAEAGVCMKGIIFNLLEQFITERAGEDQYDAILEASNLITEDPFVGPGTYPDSDFMLLFGKTIETLGFSPEEGLRQFGRFTFSRLATHFPIFVAPYSDPKSFLKTVDSVIHVEVQKLYEGVETPRFIYHDIGPDRLVIEYSSPRKLCHFMEGLIEGTADYFKSPIQYRQEQCLLRGDSVCLFDLEFHS